MGFNVAVVFNVKDETELPSQYQGFNVVNGDLHDLTWLHKSETDKGIIVGLKAKGLARKDTTGFVVKDF
jgi:hypothetical protein